MTSRKSPPVVVLTGASSGIGLATARELARRGYALALAARRVEQLEALAHELDPTGTRIIAIPTDVTDAAARENLITATRAHFGKIDVLVNNAGVDLGGGRWWDDPDPLRILRVNLEAPIELVRLVLPEMRSRGSGHIVNVGSVAGQAALNGMYSASKFGLRGFTQGLRRELLGSGVRVSLIAPGFVESEITAGSPLPLPKADIVARALADVLLLPRAEVVVPGYYRPLIWLNNAFPAAADWLVRQVLLRP